jgi:hypothetical protein
MSWAYDPKTKTTGPASKGLINRLQLEDAIDALRAAGIRNRNQLVDALVNLCGDISKSEIKFNVDLVNQNHFLKARV